METTSVAGAWDSFIPDLAVGIVTGLIVGLFVLFAQNMVESRKQRFAVTLDWEAIKPKVASAAYLGWSQNLDSFLPGPAALQAIYEIANDRPIPLWRRTLKDRDSILRRIEVLIQLRSTYINCATEAEAAIEIMGIGVAESSGIPLEIIQRIVRARAYNSPDLEAFLTVVGSGETQRSAAASAASSLTQIDRVQNALARYKEVTDLYTIAISDLRAASRD